MVRIGGGWNTLDNYLARCDPCRPQKNSSSTSSPTATNTSTTVQSPTSESKRVSERQRQPLIDKRLDSNCNDSTPSSLGVTMTTVDTSGQQQQQPMTQRAGDLLLTSLPVYNCRISPPTTDHIDELLAKRDDVTQDSAAAERGSVECDNDCDSVDSTSPCHRTVPPSSSSSDAVVASTPADVSCSCTRLMSGDDARRRSTHSRTLSCRPSRIPVPLRVAALCRSHSAALLRGSDVSDEPSDRQTDSHQHRRCDSGLDLNLSPPQFD